MRNIKLTIEYDGTNYQGWQRQRNTHLTLQETIEKTLERILQSRVSLTASGRTDAGVHAQGQVANFKTNSKIPLKNLKQALNSLLPEDIVIKKAQEVSLKFHPRFDAKSKLYRYTILNQMHPSALCRNSVYFVPYKLDFKLMQKAARLLIGRRDFVCFQASGARRPVGISGSSDKGPRAPRARNSIRTIERIKVSRQRSFIFIDIQANGFLYKMVRNIVGTLIEIGRKRQSPIKMQRILASGSRQFAGPTVPGRGLCLLRVKY